MVGRARGFTLIELLIVVAIIGILAAVAIPQFASYRIRSYNSAALNDLKNTVMGEEAYFNDNYNYLAIPLQVGPGQVGSGGLGSGTLLPMIKLSKNVSVHVIVSGDSITTSYMTGATSHVQGNRTFSYEPDEGLWKYRSKVAGVSQSASEVTAASSSVDFASDGFL